MEMLVLKELKILFLGGTYDRAPTGHHFAGGGIAGLSGGKRFGPPPESGPMPQGGGFVFSV